jgi:hypothetical protein
MKNITRSTLITLMLVMSLSACIRSPAALAPTTSRELATPIADSPAAGFCAEHEGSLVSVTINPDMPDPRCSLVSPDQYLRVVNMRGEMIKVSFVGNDVDIEPGGEHTFDQPFGNLLMPGVHHFAVSPCCGAELVLRANP